MERPETLTPMDETLLSYPRVDQKKIDELRSFDESGSLLRQLFDIFKRETDIKVREMKMLYIAQDFKQLNQAAHRYRSTCYNAAAARMGEISKRIELLAASDSAQHEIESLIQYLEGEVFSTLSELERQVRYAQ